MSRRRLALALVLVPAIVVIALGLAWREQARVHAEVVAEPAPVAVAVREHASTEEPTVERARPSAAPAPEVDTARPVEHRDRDRAAWSAARAEIATALERRGSSPALRRSDDDAAPEGTLTKEYIRERVREDVVPLVEECYGDLLERHPTIGGRMVLKFAIMGDESVGGVIDGVELAEDSEIDDADFRECLTESTMSAVFDPPEGGGRMEITYPLVFSVEPDEGAPAPG